MKRISFSFGFFAVVAVMIYFGQDSLSFFAAAAIHELGHLLAMMIVGKCEVKIVFSAFGIAIEPKYRILPKKGEEIFILLAGPLAGVVSAVMLRGYSESFFAAGIALSFVNMLPLKGLDGGSVYRIIKGGEAPHFDMVSVAGLLIMLLAAAVFCVKNSLPIWMGAVVFTMILLRHISSGE